jgi:hydroxymethylglutaryl-CoA lyase
MFPRNAEGHSVNISIYEVGPRDGLQALKEIVPTATKKQLIASLYAAGLHSIEEVSFAHPRLVPQMADAEEVFDRGSALVMNKRGFDRAVSVGVKKFNIVFSPCETFNMQNMGKTRSEIVLMYKTFMDKVPKENVRVYISMAFGSPASGQPSVGTLISCIRDAKMFGDTVVFADTVGAGTRKEVAEVAELAKNEGMRAALHLHHNGNEGRALELVRVALLNGIHEIDSSVGGLGGCPFAENSGANLSTETLVTHLHAWGFTTGVDEEALKVASRIAEQITLRNASR